VSPARPAGHQRPGFRGTVLCLLRELRPDRTRVALVLVLAAVGSGMMVTIPTLLGAATDTIVSGVRQGRVDLAEVAPLLVLAGVLAALSWSCTFIQARLIATVVQRMAFRLRERTEATLASLPLRYFDTRPRGDILSRTTNDIDNVAQAVQQMANRLLSSLCLFVGSFVMMLRISLPPGLPLRRSGRRRRGLVSIR
jgi:ATP-binding cassette subfamily B multidrug efflux pump